MELLISFTEAKEKKGETASLPTGYPGSPPLLPRFLFSTSVVMLFDDFRTHVRPITDNPVRHVAVQAVGDISPSRVVSSELIFTLSTI
jgi:hypothetical protein